MVTSGQPRAAIVTNKPPGFSGGVERFNFYLENLLRSSGYAVDFYHCENTPLPQRLHPRFGINQITYAISAHARRHKRQYGIIVSNGGFGWGLGPPGPGQKFFNVYHGTTAGLTTALRPFMSYESYFWPHYLTDGFVERMSGLWKTKIAVAESVRQQVQKAYGHRAVVVNNGIDTDHFKQLPDKAGLRRKYGIPQDVRVGLFSGRPDYYVKGFDRLIEIIRRRTDICWLFALGGGTTNLSELLPAGSFRILQDVPYQDMPEVYTCADFELYLSRYEGNAYYLLEALACGLPVIATPAGAAAEIYSDPVLARLYLPGGTDSPSFFDDIAEKLPLCFDPTVAAAFCAQARSLMERNYSLVRWQADMRAALGLSGP